VDSGSCGGIVSAPLWLAAADLRAGRAVELLHEWRDVEFTTYFLRPDRRLTPQRVNRVIADTNMSSPAAAATPKAGHVQGCVRAARSVKRLSQSTNLTGAGRRWRWNRPPGPMRTRGV